MAGMNVGQGALRLIDLPLLRFANPASTPPATGSSPKAGGGAGEVER